MYQQPNQNQGEKLRCPTPDSLLHFAQKDCKNQEASQNPPWIPKVGFDKKVYTIVPQIYIKLPQDFFANNP